MFPHVTIDIIEEMHISWSKLYYEYTLYDRFALVLKLFSLDDLTGKRSGRNDWWKTETAEGDHTDARLCNNRSAMALRVHLRVHHIRH